MLQFVICLGLYLQMVLSDPAPATNAAVTAAPKAPPFVPNIANPTYNGFNGYRPFYNPPNAHVPILNYSNNRGPDGSYSYSYATGDGKQAQESGYLKNAYIDNNGSPQGTQVVEGSYAYTSPEGIPIRVNYVADENGFQPAGIHIPADGKGVAPALLGNGVAPGYLGNGVAPGYLGNGYNNLFDPRFNRFNNYNPRYNGLNNYRNPYNFNQYDSRRFDPRYNLYNPYHGVNENKKSS